MSRQRTLTAILAGLATTAITAALTGAALAEEEPVLNVYNWSDYIAEDTISNFEADTGIKVNYDVFDSNETLEAKLLAGNSGYDVVVPSGVFLQRQIQAGLFLPLDKAKLSNWGNLDPAVMERAVVYDPGNAHAIDYMWGTTGFGYNVDKIAERMPDAPVDSWDMIFKPEIADKFADCGITLLDSPSDMIEIAYNYLGIDPHSQSTDDLKKAEELLLSIRPYVRYFHNSQQINDLANGEVCLSVGWSGDILIASDRAAEADNGVEVAYVIPEEGTNMWFDLMAIPVDAPHPENAHKFINYILEPEVAAEITNYVYYASGNKAALEFVEPEIKEDPAIYPPAEVMANLFVGVTPEPRYDRQRTRAWTRIRTGQ